MNKNHVYNQVIEYAKANNINYAVTAHEEICPEVDLNGYSFLDTNTFEIPCSFSVDKAVILCIDTPVDMTPEDTGKSYGKYWSTITDLNKIAKPQYVAVDGAYVKLMCWCDWEGEEDQKRDFIEACNEALEVTVNDHKNKSSFDFRLFLGDDVTPFIFSDTENMWNFVKDLVGWNIEIYAILIEPNMAITTNHGIKCHNNSGLRIIEAY